jgi:methionyl-tRNA formyltransferase
LRTVYLGTSEFAADVLRTLADSPHRPQLVITRPDRPRGRGRRLASPPVADAARELGIDLDQPGSVNEEPARERIAAARPDAVCVCAFGALITEPLLSEHPILNVHPSLLPRWRGAAPIERAIMAGDAETGVSIMRLEAGLDSGPVAAVRREPIAREDTYGTLAPRLATIGAELLIEVLETRPELVAQDDSAATYADKIGPADRLLDPGRPAIENERVVRALHPHIGARLELGDGRLLGVRRARALDAEDERAAGALPEPGGLSMADGRLLLGCADGALELLEVQPPGGRAMDAAAYLRGHGAPGRR